MRYVFVYGTLRAGEINDMSRAATRHGIVAPTLLGRVTLAGELYDFGTFPGMVAAPPGDGRSGAARVRGDLYVIDERLVPVLDEIERVYPGVDSMFVRAEVDIELDGRRYPCMYYPVAVREIAGRARIESGDWIAYRRERDRVPA